ncbi:MAG: TolC family protein [Acidobacteriota bacterium]|nr:TolC family protein [Acidobacteriota bacterium]
MAAVLGGASALRADEPLRIETYVEIVLRSHPAMQAARALDESATAEKLGARLLPDPTLEVSVGRGRSTADSSERGTETGFTLSQVIPWFPARAATIDAADHAAQARRAEASAARWSLSMDARLAFYRLVEARALVEVASLTEADARSLLDLVTRRASLGETREVDRIKARVEWLKQQRELRGAEREADAAEATLRTLAASPLSQPLLLSGELSRPLDAMRVLREATPDRLERSPEALRARAEAARAASLLKSARRSRVPDLGFSLFRQKEVDREAFGASLGIVLPLWNARRGDIARAGAESMLRTADVDRIRLTLLTVIEARRRDVDTSAAQAAILMNELVPSAAESLRLARLLFDEGETSLLDLLDAQRTARDARREEIRARFELAVALSELQRLLGPGDITGRNE